jgi:hypothetical protein
MCQGNRSAAFLNQIFFTHHILLLWDLCFALWYFLFLLYKKDCYVPRKRQQKEREEKPKNIIEISSKETSQENPLRSVGSEAYVFKSNEIFVTSNRSVAWVLSVIIAEWF